MNPQSARQQTPLYNLQACFPLLFKGFLAIARRPSAAIKNEQLPQDNWLCVASSSTNMPQPIPTGNRQSFPVVSIILIGTEPSVGSRFCFVYLRRDTIFILLSASLLAACFSALADTISPQVGGEKTQLK